MFWTNLVELLQTVPKEIIFRYGSKGATESSGLGISQAEALMNDLLSGLTSRDEPRNNLKTGWAAYYDIGIWVSTPVPENERSELVTWVKSSFATEHLRIGKFDMLVKSSWPV